jgi:diadenosine tetraphosphate (Ap4A) HIT family hydrolase
MADLTPAEARHVGLVLAKSARVLEEAAGADRVYILSFAEIDRRLHFHLFPRTAQILSAFCAATGGDPKAVNGPMLFEWARASYPPGQRPSGAASRAAAMLEDLRRRLAD